MHFAGKRAWFDVIINQSTAESITSPTYNLNDQITAGMTCRETTRVCLIYMYNMIIKKILYSKEEVEELLKGFACADVREDL